MAAAKKEGISQPSPRVLRENDESLPSDRLGNWFLVREEVFLKGTVNSRLKNQDWNPGVLLVMIRHQIEVKV